MSDTILSGRAVTTTYTHDKLIKEARAGTQVFEASDVAHEVLVEDSKPSFDLVDFSSLLPPSSFVWVEYKFPPVSNVAGRFEVLPAELGGVAAFIKIYSAEALSEREWNQVLKLQPWHRRRGLKRRTAYLLTNLIMLEVLSETGRSLLPPVIAHHHLLDEAGVLTLKNVMQEPVNAFKLDGEWSEEFFEAFRTFQYPVFALFDRLKG